jgi:hypothetical protein
MVFKRKTQAVASSVRMRRNVPINPGKARASKINTHFTSGEVRFFKAKYIQKYINIYDV